MKKVDEFDWEWTRRKVMVIIPYYGKRLRQMTYALSGIRTMLNDREWGIVIGDDGCGHDISSVESIKNVKVVKVRNDGAPERNGCLCRNVLIKRCQSEWIISVDPEIHWSGDFFSTICERPRHVVRTGNTRNISIDTSESVLNGTLDINNVDYKVFKDFYPRNQINQNSILIINPSKPELMGTWGVHYGLAAPVSAWHALRGYNEKMTDYGPDDGDMMERMMKMMKNSILWRNDVWKKGEIKKLETKREPQFWQDVEATNGLIDNFYIAANIFATHIYHERLTGRINGYLEERRQPGFIRNRDIEWGMSYDK